MEPFRLELWMDSFKKWGSPEIIATETFYELRHSGATFCLSNNVDLQRSDASDRA